MNNVFTFGNRSLSLDRSHVMGVLNTTPDSFSDGGKFNRLDAAILHAEVMVNAGASFIDIGGESTRPGARSVSSTEEIDRVMPVLERVIAELDVAVSVDTSNPELIRAAGAGGAHLINDVRALQKEGAMRAAVETGLPVCLMHMQGTPETMQNRPDYGLVEDEVAEFLRQRIKACHNAGLSSSQILIDPGFGFGKSKTHNLRLLNRLESLSELGCPLLVGLSRKSLIDHVLSRSVDQRLPASLALAAAAVLKGAWIVRVHDVAESYDAVMMMNAIRHEGEITI